MATLDCKSGMASLSGKEDASCEETTALQETEIMVNNGQNHTKVPVKMDEAKSSKYESLCKIIAVILVVVAFVSHLLRGAHEGRFSRVFYFMFCFHALLHFEVISLVSFNFKVGQG